MSPMTTKSLPNHASDLYPSCPSCDVTANDEATGRAMAVRVALEAQRDQLKARQHEAWIALPNLFVAGKPVDALLDEVADLDNERRNLETRITAVSQAEVNLMGRRHTLELTDPVYRAWEARCSEIDLLWGHAMAGLPKLDDDASMAEIDRARTSALYGIVAQVGAEQNTIRRFTRDGGFIGRRR